MYHDIVKVGGYEVAVMAIRKFNRRPVIIPHHPIVSMLPVAPRPQSVKVDISVIICAASRAAHPSCLIGPIVTAVQLDALVAELRLVILFINAAGGAVVGGVVIFTGPCVRAPVLVAMLRCVCIIVVVRIMAIMLLSFVLMFILLFFFAICAYNYKTIETGVRFYIFKKFVSQSIPVIFCPLKL